MIKNTKQNKIEIKWKQKKKHKAHMWILEKRQTYYDLLPSLGVQCVRVENQCLRVRNSFDDVNYGKLCSHFELFDSRYEKLLVRALNCRTKQQRE